MRRDIAMFLALVAVVGGGVIAVAFLLFGGGGDGGESNTLCDQPLPPSGESEISQVGFQAEDAGLANVIEAASAGDLEAAEEAFLYANDGEVRNFAYDVDQPLREVDETLAKELCEAVNKVEEGLIVDQRVDQVAVQARRVRELMRDAAVALGYARPGQ